jgi:hypothetical protein
MTCGGCQGSGRRVYSQSHGEIACGWCGGSGLAIDERRLELVDAIADELSDACDMDTSWHVYASRVLALLEARGLDPMALEMLP